VILGFFINCFNAAPVTAENSLLLEKIVENRDFFVNYDGSDVKDYGGSLLCDINDFGANMIGLLLLEPSGFLKSIVFNRTTGTKIHEDASILPKNIRNAFARSGISIADARLVAQNIAGFSKGQANGVGEVNEKGEKKAIHRKATRHEAVKQPVLTVSSNMSRQKPVDTKKALERFREEVSRSSEFSAMATGEIIRRFRAELQEAGASK